MINDIRYAASQLIRFSDSMPVQSGFNNQQSYDNMFENMIAGQDKQVEPEKQNNSFMPLGIPAGFNIDFSLLEEMENQ